MSEQHNETINELMVVFGKNRPNGVWLYFKTKKSTVKEALDELKAVCAEKDLNYDNMPVYELVLRDNKENDLEKWTV